MITVTKDFRFEASHSLPHLGHTHKCSRPHGHSYKFSVECTGEPDDRSFVIDYAEISQVVSPIVDMLDHRDLNTILPLPTTAENLAIWLFNKIKKQIPILSGIVFYETSTTSVIYRP